VPRINSTLLFASSDPREQLQNLEPLPLSVDPYTYNSHCFKHRDLQKTVANCREFVYSDWLGMEAVPCEQWMTGLNT
jgi:hypothetical protein